MSKSITKIDNKGIRKQLRVAAYCRVSTDLDDQLESLEAQKSHYERLIAENPEWISAGIYFDRGISGTKLKKRPAMLRLISDCEDGKVDLILTKSISRFARNTTDCLELVRKLNSLGISVLFESENINTGDMEGELMLTILSSMAAEESASISKNARWSIQKRFESGTYIIASPPYGYANHNGEMEIVPSEAEVVRSIFKSFLSGKSTYVIAKELQERQIPSKRGGAWQSSTILGILKNEKYVGDVLLQKTWTDGRFNRHINHGEYDQFLIPDHHEPIVARKEFEAAQALINHQFSEKGGEWDTDKYQKRYLFTSKLICSECGKPLHRKIYPRQGGSHIVWACMTHINDRESCSMKAVEQEAVETAFTTMMNKLVFSKDVLARPFARQIRMKAEAETDIGDMEKRMADNNKQRTRLAEMFREGLIDSSILNEENNALLSEYEILDRELGEILSGKKEIVRQAELASELLSLLNEAEVGTCFDEQVFSEITDHIDVISQAEFIISLKCGLKLREVV